MTECCWQNVFLIEVFTIRLDGAREDLTDMVIVHEMKEVQELLNAHNYFKSTISDADNEFRTIVNIEQVGISSEV